MKVIGGLVVALLAAVGIVVAHGGQPASGQDDKKVVLNIGMQQGIDNMNVVRGVTVAAFEAWNMQFATLTDKAAEDFAPMPGLAESWTSSADKKTWTYKLRPDMKWSDGQPLTAEDVAYTINRSRDEAWLNHSAGRGEPQGARDLADRARGQDVGPRPEAADARRLHRAQARLRQVRREGAHEVQRADRRRLGPVHAGRVQEGPVRALQGQPELLRREAGDRRGRDPRVQQRRRDGRRAAQSGEIDFVQNVARDRRSSASRRTRTSSPSRARRAASTSSR